MAVKLGERQLAKDLLGQILQKEPRNEQALLWRAALAETPTEGIALLEKVVEINPNNQQALSTLSMLRLRAVTHKPQGPPPGSASGPGATLRRIVVPPKPLVPASRPGEPGLLSKPSAPLAGQSPNSGFGNKPAGATANAPRPEAPPAERMWVCPLCETHTTGTPVKCRGCGVIYQVEALDVIAQNFETKEATVLEAVQRLDRTERDRPTAEGQLNLARAFLNLCRSNDAIPHLRKAAELDPSNRGVRKALDQLSARKVIMAVDDSLTIRRILTSLLERNGYRVVAASDGQEALQKVTQLIPDLIILDVMMPGMNGYDVCKALRHNANTKPVPVVMLSASILDRIRGKLAGVTDYLAKPFEPEALLAKTKSHLAKSTGR